MKTEEQKRADAEAAVTERIPDIEARLPPRMTIEEILTVLKQH